MKVVTSAGAFISFDEVIWLGLMVKDLAFHFQVSPGKVSQIFITWIKFLSQELSVLIIWPSARQIKSMLPNCCKKLYISEGAHYYWLYRGFYRDSIQSWCTSLPMEWLQISLYCYVFSLYYSKQQFHGYPLCMVDALLISL